MTLTLVFYDFKELKKKLYKIIVLHFEISKKKGTGVLASPLFLR